MFLNSAKKAKDMENVLSFFFGSHAHTHTYTHWVLGSASPIVFYGYLGQSVTEESLNPRGVWSLLLNAYQESSLHGMAG